MLVDSIVRAGDPARIRALVAATGFFRPDEIEVAGELAEEALADPASYRFIFLRDAAGVAQAYSCFGEICLTEGSYDLYWIVVAPDLQGKGRGRTLLAATEAAIRDAGGRLLYAETSGTELYAPTREFYRCTGFEQVAIFPDFYRPDDDKLVYGKRL